MPAISSTAARNAPSLAFEGLLKPVIFLTNWSEAARVSSAVTGGSKLNRVLIFLHIQHDLKVRTPKRAREICVYFQTSLILTTPEGFFASSGEAASSRRNGARQDLFGCGNYSRRARAGSVRIARQAGRKHAASEAINITSNADPNASGSRGLTW